MNAPSLSFLVPVFNVQRYLDACVESILPVVQPGDEIVLLDDGSTDDSGRMCESWQQRHPDVVKVVHQANQGLSAARNAALQAASKDYVYFLDSDDLLCAESFTPVRAALSAHHPDILTCDALIWREDVPGQPLERIRHSLPAGLAPSREAALMATFKDDFLSSSSRVFDRNFLDTMGPAVFPPGKTYEDNATIPRLVAAASSVAYLAEPLFRYRIRQGSITQTHSVQRCIDQATSFKGILPLMAHGAHGVAAEAQANILAFKHLVRAVRNASLIRPASREHFECIVASGLATLTLPPNVLEQALRAQGLSDLLSHAQGMLHHRRRYLFARTLSAHWKQWREARKRRGTTA